MNVSVLKRALGEGFRKLSRRSLPPVEVAVIDSGVDSRHPMLRHRIAAAFRVGRDVGRQMAAARVPVPSNNDAFGHGTGVASIIARLAPNARIVDIGVIGGGNKGSGEALLEGMRLAIERRSRIINMSLAALPNLAGRMRPLCEEAYRQNQIVVAAKRNMPLADMGYPAEFSSTVSVDTLDLPSPWHVQYFPDEVIEFAALGENVRCAAPDGHYTSLTGTSFATPTISGLCALLVGAHPEIRPFEVKSLLRAFSDPEA